MDRNSRLCKINKRLLLIELLDYYLSFEHLLEREKLGSFDLLSAHPPTIFKHAYVFITRQMYKARSQELEAMLQFKIPQDSPQT